MGATAAMRLTGKFQLSPHTRLLTRSILLPFVSGIDGFCQVFIRCSHFVCSHISPVDINPEPESETIVSATDKKLETGNPIKTNISNNEEAFTNNQTISVDKEGAKDDPEPEVSLPAADPKAEGVTTADIEMGDAHLDVPAPEAAKETPSAPLDEKSAEEPAVLPKSHEPPSSESTAPEAIASASKPDPSPDAAAGEARKEDVEMDDAPAPADPSSNPEQVEGTQDTIVSNVTATTPGEDLSLRPESMSSLAIDVPPVSPAPIGTADTSMTDAAQSPTKVSRERDDDGGDEPAAKRAKTDLQGDSVEVKISAGGNAKVDEFQAEQAPLVNTDGEPKNLADASLEGNSITQWQARKLRGILAGIKKTKAGANFKAPVETLWPGLWHDYQAKVPDPTDIGTMEKRLKGGDPSYKAYATIGDFKNDLQLLYENSVRFNGEVHDVTRHAQTVRDQVLEKMAAEPAVEAVKADKRETVKHHPSRHPGPRAPSHPPPPARRPSKAPVASPVDKPVESPAFAIPPNNNGVPLIRRDSTKNADDRPKRPIHPPKNKDLGYEPKKKKKLSPDLRFCDEVLTELKKVKYHDLNQYFLAPVDPIALNIPNYHKVVKKPMDLQTMSDKLHTAQYSSSKEFERDFHLVIKNCKSFNGDDHFVTQKALELEKLFKREWARKDDWMARHAAASTTAAMSHASAMSPHGRDDSDEDDAESEAEADDEKEQSSATLEALQRRLAEEEQKVKGYMNSKNPDMGMVEVSQSLVFTLQKQIIQERQKLSVEAATSKKPKSKPAKSKKAGGVGKKANAAAGIGSGGVSGGASKKAAGGGKKGKRAIGTLEKEIIATAVPSLDGDLLNRAIDIIKKDTNENVSRKSPPTDLLQSPPSPSPNAT